MDIVCHGSLTSRPSNTNKTKVAGRVPIIGGEKFDFSAREIEALAISYRFRITFHNTLIVAQILKCQPENW